jgi:hypothetical protein
MYHSHVDTDTQINMGLFGDFVIDPKSWAQIKPNVDVYAAQRMTGDRRRDLPGPAINGRAEHLRDQRQDVPGHPDDQRQAGLARADALHRRGAV